jgi:hypothetical protein
VARLNPRLAAGVGVLSVFLLLGGSGAGAAIADPGGSHSGRGGSSELDDGTGTGESVDRDSGTSDIRRGFDDGVVSGERPQVRVGSGRDDTQQRLPSDRAVSGGGFGPDHSGTSDGGFKPPRVTVGNGRSPGIQSDDDPAPRWRAPAPEPAPAPPPPPPPVAPAVPSWADRISTPPPVPQQLSIAPAADWSDPLWGIAGLLLIPAAGAALGYRQARAAHAAERLDRP